MLLPNQRTRAGLAALELELLARIALDRELHRVPSVLPDVFDCAADMVPRWAAEACERLLIAGRVRELPGGKLELIDPTSAPILRAA